MIPLLFALMTVHIGPVVKNVPARQPQLAADGARIVLAYGEGNAIYVTTSTDGGTHFAPAVKVSESGKLMLGRHRGPRVAIAGPALVVTAIVEDKGGDGNLYAWRSSDGGAHWSKGVVVNDVAKAAREGLDGLGSDGSGKLFVAWLDDRNGPKQLWGAQSTDGGATWSKNAQLYASPDGHICECCHPSVAMDASGKILVMWRNWLGGSRDMYLMRSDDGVRFSAAEKMGTGTWPLNACPMDGGGVVVSGAKAATAWRRGESVFLAMPGQAETKLGDGKDVALAFDGDQVRAAFTSGTKIVSWSAGKSETLSDAGAFPAMTRLPAGGVAVAWEEAGAISVRVVR